MRCAFAVGLFSILLAAHLPSIGLASAAQEADPSLAAAISGVVVDAVTGGPVAGAVVHLRVVGAPAVWDGSRQVTDDRGRFVFTDVPPGSSTSLLVSRSGYLEATFGAATGPGRILVRPGAWVNDVRVELWRPGVIAGRVFDDRGDPVVNVWVRAVQLIDLLGRTQAIVGEPTVTDDQGRYRLTDLQPGSYVLQVPTMEVSMSAVRDARDPAASTSSTRPGGRHFPVPPATVDGQRRTYAPALTPQPSADGRTGALSLEPGEHREGIDIVLQSAPSFMLAGRVAADGASFGGLQLRLIPEGLAGLGPMGAVAVARVRSDGAFAFCCVAAGRYTLTAGQTAGFFSAASPAFVPSFTGLQLLSDTGQSPPSLRGVDLAVGPPGLMLTSAIPNDEQPLLWVRQSIDVGADLTDVVVPLRPAGSMRGRLHEDVDARLPRSAIPAALTLSLDPIDDTPGAGSPQASIQAPRHAEGEFSMSGIAPARYRLRARNGWLVKSVAWAGRDYTDRPFDATDTQAFEDVDVIVTNAGATIAGHVRAERSAVGQDATVFVFPDDPSTWTDAGLQSPRIRTSGLTADGEFEIAGLPAGRYAVATVRSPRLALQPGPDLFGTLLARATRIVLDWGERRAVNLALREDQP